MSYLLDLAYVFKILLFFCEHLVWFPLTMSLFGDSNLWQFQDPSGAKGIWFVSNVSCQKMGCPSGSQMFFFASSLLSVGQSEVESCGRENTEQLLSIWSSFFFRGRGFLVWVGAVTILVLSSWCVYVGHGPEPWWLEHCVILSACILLWLGKMGNLRMHTWIEMIILYKIWEACVRPCLFEL
jgi:uncharacterized membrane protein (UPF0136 family)